ncbi:hypothetical protein LAZ67_1005361 [Cordylochernes scorpioides]|uniref:Transposase Tc1-like domain-containing protein n=1 Tax=Cordylochernes scorpioides TaxID=51811 RepID=A0ABY6K179_9ARAC|nr:hypothetical protein LAZ67_1005361 [Cordylochernes scorpioides]
MPISTVSMPRRKIRAHYEHMSEFETGRAIGLKEAGWSNQLIARHLCRSDAAIRRCWQKWVNNGSMQRQDGSGRPRATTEREDRAIVRMAVAAPESTLSTIQRVTGTQVSKMTINRRLRGRNLRARRPLRCLPLTPVHRQVRLQWCRERSTWNCADWGRIVFSDESRFLLCPDDRRKSVWRRPGQRVDPGLTVEHHTGPQQGVMVWDAISFVSRTPLVVIPGTLTAQRYGLVETIKQYNTTFLLFFHKIDNVCGNLRLVVMFIQHTCVMSVSDISSLSQGPRHHHLFSGEVRIYVFFVDHEIRGVAGDVLVILHQTLSMPISTVSMPRRKIRAHYEHMSEFETGRAIGLKEAGWSNRLIARHLCRSDAAIRRCWQKWVNNGSMQRQDGSGRPRATTEREDRAIVRMAVAAPESTLSTIQRVTGTQVSKMTINRRLRERNLRARRPPAYPSHPCTDKSDYSGVGSDQLGTALTGDV